MKTRAVSLGELGENRVVAELTRALARDKNVRVGAGDDCAVIGGPRDARWQLLKTDALVESVHFQSDENPRRIGWKALCRAISDVAAMGGEPAHALITIAAPSQLEFARLRGIYAGLRRAARRFGVSIVGGETSRSPGPLFISVALTGWVEKTRCTPRSGGRPGDAIFVTGRLGGSLTGRHLDFIPRLIEARWLVTHFKIRAMMDLSDGLAADLPRLAAASGCGFEIDERAIPKNRGCTVGQALSDGEDYELLFAVDPKTAITLQGAWAQRFPDIPLTRIGALCDSRLSTFNSSLSRGFDHFAQR